MTSLTDPATACPTSGSKLRLAYLVGNYPAVSCTFICREITQLQTLGIEILPVSVNKALPSAHGFSEAERREEARTFFITQRAPWRILGDHFSCFLRRPRAFVAGLLQALKLGAQNPTRTALHLAYFAEAVILGEWMQKRQLKHVHVHFANASSTVALLTARMYGLHYSISVHGPDEFYGARAYNLREKMENALFVCCIGNFCRSQLMLATPSSHWSKFEIARLGVDPDSFLPVRSRRDGQIRLLCVGRLVAAKAQQILLRAVAIMKQQGFVFSLDIAGDGPDRVELESQARLLEITDYVTFHGSLDQGRVHELLARTDIFVLPSFAEGIPVALMEAMSMEIPCVSTTIAGIPELIDSNVSGILVPPSDPELLAAAIGRLINDPEFRARIGAAARQKIVSTYNLKPNVVRLAGIFQQRLGSLS